MTIKDLNIAVVAEATALRKKATKEELVTLTIDRLTPFDYRGCIYGQMTGNCFSPRASSLINSCAPILLNGTINGRGNVTNVKDRKSYKSKRRNQEQNSGESSYHWSPIEVFITVDENKDNGNIERLIDFLKGKSKSLKLV